jgi:BirA family transcriptional regulator, biotin operon repressor / biotin---[acetyl-CoA-carboxylase] ligase
MDTRYDIIILDSVPSTQDVAAAQHAATGATSLVVTSDQTGGRGRSGRRWVQADRGIAASLALAPQWEPRSWGLIPLVAGLAVRRAIAELTGIMVGLKWPNDLMAGDAKVGGILSEASGGAVTVGCGVNMWWLDPPEGAGALLASDPGPVLGPRLAETWAGRLLDMLETPADRWGREEYMAASVTIGAAVRWESGEGTARDIAADGGLVVATDSGSVTLRSGEVHLLR